MKMMKPTSMTALQIFFFMFFGFRSGVSSNSLAVGAGFYITKTQGRTVQLRQGASCCV
jgi:hypothetical protein